MTQLQSRLAARATLALAIVLVAVFATTALAIADSGSTSGDRVWSWWVADPLAILFFAGFGFLYWRGLRDWRRRSRPVRWWQIGSYYLGLVAMFAALVSPLDPLSDQLFSAHQVQHILLRIVGPVLILLGAPLTPVLRGLPHSVRMGVVRPIVSNPAARSIYRWLNHPLWIPVVFLLVLFIWQFPAAHDRALGNLWIHYAMHLSMTSTSMLFWWLIIDPKPHRSSLHYGVRILIMAATILPNTVLGAVITFSDSVLYAGYGAARLWSITALEDQQWGGLIGWLSADMMTVATAAVIFGMWYIREQQPARSRRPGRPAAARRPVTRP